MDPEVLKFRIGVMVLASLVLLGVMVLLFGDLERLWQPTYQIHVRMPDATGVQRGTPVRKRGLLIGRVSNVKLDDDAVVLTLDINRDVTLRRDEVCVRRTSLFGDAEIVFLPPREAAKPEPVERADHL